MPAKRVIILDRLLDAETHAGEGTSQQWRYVLLADVPFARQPFYATATATSAWKDASAADLTALQTGAVVERVGTVLVLRTATTSEVRLTLQDEWQAFQDRVTAFNPWLRHGTFWDGTTWTAGGVT